MTDPTTAAALRLLLAELGPEWRYAGSVAVDSGGLLLIDPAAEPPPPLPIAAGTLYAELFPSDCPALTAVVCSPGLGDGRYPVVVRVVDLPGWGERVAEVRVLFFPELQGVG